MAKDSPIEWTHHTFNPWWGCLRVSQGCKHCYADTWAKRFGDDLWSARSERKFFGDAHWREPLKWQREANQAGGRRRVFCASMGDVFEDRAELDAHRARLWRLIECTPNLDWLLLTKRIENVKHMVPWSQDWPANVWLGATMENQAAADERVEHLLHHNAAVRFVSAEPLLGALDLTPWLSRKLSCRIDWVIAGGESGAEARWMNPAWPQSLRDQCLAHDVAFHFKQWGHWAPAELIEETVAAKSQRVTLKQAAGLIDLVRVGKVKAGRVLDGQTWNQFPTVAI